VRRAGLPTLTTAMSEHNVFVARDRCEAFVRNHLAVSPPELDPDTESDETNLSDRGGARDQPTCAKDQQQKRRLSVLLLDVSGTAGSHSILHRRERSRANSGAHARLDLLPWCDTNVERRLDVEDQVVGCGAVQEMEEPGHSARSRALRRG
jgi:hypothetical protein